MKVFGFILIFASFAFAKFIDDALTFKTRIGFTESGERIVAQKFFDNDRKLVLIGKKAIQFWDVSNGKLIETYPHEIPNLDKFDTIVEISPDATKAIVLDSFSWRLIRKEKKVSASIYNLQNGKLLTVLERPSESIRDSEWSENGKTLVTYSGVFNDKRTEICFWNGDNLKFLGAILLKGSIEYKKLTKDGKVFLAKVDKADSYQFKYGLDDYLTAWNTDTAKPIQNFSSGKDRQMIGWNNALTDDEKFIAMKVGSYSSERISVWQIGGSDLPVYEIFPQKKGGSIYFLGVVDNYFVIHQNKTLEFYDSADRQLRLSIPNQKTFTTNPRNFSLLPNRKTLVIESCEKANFFDLTSAQKQFEIKLVCKTDFDLVSTSYRDFDVLRFHPKLPYLVTFSDKTVRVWNVENGALVQTIIDPNRIENKKKDNNKDDGLGWSANWIRNGEYLFASGADGKSILFWEIKN